MISQGGFDKLYVNETYRQQSRRNSNALVESIDAVGKLLRHDYESMHKKQLRKVNAERQLLEEIYALYNSELFGYVMDNKIFGKRIEEIYEKNADKLKVAESEALLKRICGQLSDMLKQYKEAFDRYKNDMIQSFEHDKRLQEIDKDDLRLIKEVLNNEMLTMDMFNRLNNDS